MSDDELAAPACGEQKKRPNANYNLSKPDDYKPAPNEGLTFYYNRERRLAKAPKEVRDLYIEKKKRGFGFLGVLIADRPRKLLFSVIVILCVLILIFARTGLLNATRVLEGNKIEISGTVFEGTAIVILRKTAGNTDAYTGAVDIAITIPVHLLEDGSIPEGHPVFSHRIFFTLEKEETFRFVVPFDDPQLLAVLQTERQNLRLRFNPE